MTPKPCPVCGLVTEKEPCARCGHVPGDVLGETAAIIEGAMLAEEAERFLAFGDVGASMKEITEEIRMNGMSARLPFKSLGVLHNYLTGPGRAGPLDEEPK